MAFPDLWWHWVLIIGVPILLLIAAVIIIVLIVMHCRNKRGRRVHSGNTRGVGVISGPPWNKPAAQEASKDFVTIGGTAKATDFSRSNAFQASYSSQTRAMDFEDVPLGHRGLTVHQTTPTHTAYGRPFSYTSPPVGTGTTLSIPIRYDPVTGAGGPPSYSQRY